MGSAIALSFMTWLCIRAQRAISTGELKFDTKEISTSGCTYHFIADEAMSMLAINETASTTTATATQSEFQIYHISYIWYTFLGCAICIVVALITSYILGPNNPAELNQNLLAPFVRKLIKSSSTDVTKSSKYADNIKSNENVHNIVESPSSAALLKRGYDDEDDDDEDVESRV